jgi:hypothetical protein
MLVSAPCNNDYEPDGKRFVSMSQEESNKIFPEYDNEAFGKRLREAFDNARNIEIQRRTGIEKVTLRNYLNGRIPPPEILNAISKETKCNLHWLLTGEGSKRIVSENATQPEPAASKGGKLLQEISLSEIFTNLFNEMEGVKARLSAIESQRTPNERIDAKKLAEENGFTEEDAIRKNSRPGNLPTAQNE